MLSFVRFARIALVCASLFGCATPSGGAASEDDSEILEPEEEGPLQLEIEAVTLRRGSLRIAGVMTDGSSDVSMWLNPPCEKQEVGHGIATSTNFVWSLNAEDLARALECNVTVAVRARGEDGRRIRRITDLPFSIAFASDDNAMASVSTPETVGSTTRLTFETPTPATRIHASGIVIGVEANEDEEPEESRREAPYTSQFLVSNVDLAQIVLGRRLLTILGVPIEPTVTVGAATLDFEVPEPALQVDTF